MNTVLVSLILGAGGLATAFYTLLTNVRDRKANVQQQQSDLALSKGTYDKIAADAAKINDDRRLETEKWWGDQIAALRKDLDDETNRRRRLSNWANEHQAWDRRAWRLALETDPEYPPPPQLDDT